MRLRTATTALLAVLLLGALSSGVSARPQASAEGKAKIKARLSPTSFTAARAGKIKLKYTFASPSTRFEYRLWMKKKAKWAKLRGVVHKGHFAGSRTRTIKSFFGRKKVAVGRYRLDLKADAKRISKYFRVIPPAKRPGDSNDSEGPGNKEAPSGPVKLVFIHHSTGQAWLSDSSGRLGIALRDSNYFVSDTNYGWGTDVIGSSTDIGHWWNWFRGPSSGTYLNELYQHYGQRSSYSRMASDPGPGRENEIIMFKSCFPNSNIYGNPSDAPTSGTNSLRGQGTGSSMTVANVKGIYNDILEYFSTRPDKLFVVIVTPPLMSGSTTAARAANARAVADWLMNDWLDGYSQRNVAVFDYYNVLTSNGGDANTNDLGAESGNHHRWWNGSVQHTVSTANNYLAYPTRDNHPSRAGQQKATGEFVEILNYYYHRWVDSRS